MPNIKNQVKQLSKDTVYYGMGGAIASFIAFLKAPIFTRIFIPGDYGYIDLLGTTASLFFMLMGFDLMSGIYRYYYEYKEKKDRKLLVSTGLIFTILVAIIITTIVFSLKPFMVKYIASKEITTRNNSLFLSLVLMRTPFSLIQYYFVSLLRLKREPKKYLYINIFQIIFNFTLSMALVVGLKMHLLGIFLSDLLSIVTVCLITVILLRKEVILSFSKVMFKQIFRYSLPLYPAVIINWALLRMNRFFIFNFCSEEQLGYFSVAIKVAAILQILIMAYRSAWEPFSMQLIQDKEHKEIFNKFFRYGVLFFGFVAFSISISSRPILMIIAPPSYYAASHLIPFILFGYAFNISHQSLRFGIAISKKSQFMTYAQTISFVFALFINWILITRFAALGAVIAILPVYMIKCALLYMFSTKLYKIKINFKIDIFFFTLLLSSIIFMLISYKLSVIHSLVISITVEMIAALMIFFFVLRKNEQKMITSKLSSFIQKSY
ncbi:MAG: oligosaccharide flippase family protein [Candidatus Aminicenantes bacterium]|nr:oligosaccharide flippase family protein [Candidatus Aminicenantes bacterium]